MQTILQILERAGGYRPTLSLKIENPTYMALVIKAIEPGPLGLPRPVRRATANKTATSCATRRCASSCGNRSKASSPSIRTTGETTKWPSGNGPATSSRGITWPCWNCIGSPLSANLIKAAWTISHPILNPNVLERPRRGTGCSACTRSENALPKGDHVDSAI